MSKTTTSNATAKNHLRHRSGTTEEKLSEVFESTVGDRHREILVAAAGLFAENGYASTSVRDIGQQVGLLGGSLYHYIKSKEDLFVRIHDLALQAAESRIREAVSGLDDPWDQLKEAIIALLEIQLDPNSLTMPLMNDLSSVPPKVRSRLIERRDIFEGIFRDLVDVLPVDPKLDRDIYRLLLLTLLNNVGQWYREGRLTPAEIGEQIFLLFHQRISEQTHS